MKDRETKNNILSLILFKLSSVTNNSTQRLFSINFIKKVNTFNKDFICVKISVSHI